MPYSRLFDDFDARLVRLFQEEYAASGYGTLRVRVHLPREDEQDDPDSSDSEACLGFELQTDHVAFFGRQTTDRNMTDEELRHKIRDLLLLTFDRDEYVRQRQSATP